jgi:uncharacterized membrane protein YeaQ/YmgE (transglycosylase-associated protein family)
MDLIYTLVIGALSGWLAGLLMGGKSGGLLWDIVLGVAGSFIGGWVLSKLGLHVPLGNATFKLVVTSVIGAVLLLFIASLIRSRK